ncbi:hypothetical protein [Blastopirellula retiformator]|uniref:Uncharacterized protein n=1 Tax=Blastopirellula retiformator TaxID=2527970 RepID=A0A5C5UXI4_9BACT|nr:hypothetical protein [Blastopirellula retiformator]TWT30135.1 hypothetical protein Enr8_47940 [Blastopirellula retiformator]
MTATKIVYRFTFARSVEQEDVQAAIVLALFGVESLHGRARIRLDAAHHFDFAHRACVIDASNEVGVDLSRLFTGFLLREIGDDGFQVERIEKDAVKKTAPSHSGLNGFAKPGGKA